jgi:LacI family transcriptional regulator
MRTMATIRDVATTAGVSPATVSLVLNGRRGFYSEATAKRVAAAADTLHYMPSALARSLRCGRSQAVAVVGEAPDDLHGAPMLAAVHELACRFGYSVSLLPPHDDLRHQFGDRRFDVVLIARDVSQADSISESIAGSHQIVVAAGSVSSALPTRVPAAYWRDREGLRSLAEHLAGLGHRCLAYLAGHASPKGDELAAVAGALGLATAILLWPASRDDLAAGAGMAREALTLRPRPTALIGRTDAVALGALHAVLAAGLRVPEDISVAGYYDFAFSAYVTPALTTVYTPFSECATAVLTEALVALRADGARPEPSAREVPTALRVRGSTGPVPGRRRGLGGDPRGQRVPRGETP